MKKGGYVFRKMTVRDVPLDGQTVLVRADYNLPMDANGEIEDDFRVRASVPTLRYLLERRCKVVIISHLGRPDGKKDMKYTLEPAAQRLAELAKAPVRFVADCIGDRARMAVKQSPASSLTVLENLRFYPGEEANDREFAKKLVEASGARYFIQDGFGVVHRAHASTAAITEFLPSVAGLLLEREVSTIMGAMEHPVRPLVAVLGGAKVSDKIGVIDAFVKRADQILIGGAMANTFLAANGLSVGASKVETEDFGIIEKIYGDVRDKVGKKKVDEFLYLPTDVAVAPSLDATERKVVDTAAIAPNDMALDVGDTTIEAYTDVIKKAGTVVWNGTLGYAENPMFAHGSARVALALATEQSTESIIGGGDTADFVLKWDARGGDSFTHVSTGGGASLELMAGEPLPGVEALLDAKR
ncbi:MAG TPA: phosphoglycerate kinase [Candidatus Saccharimonadaceae bacterium]|nr:phosphoglycerate kinase [Candidatus Saccharimonadaceae bacterium]